MWRVRVRVSPILRFVIEAEKCIGRSCVRAVLQRLKVEVVSGTISWFARTNRLLFAGVERWAEMTAVNMRRCRTSCLMILLLREGFLPSVVKDGMDTRLRTVFLWANGTDILV